MDQIAPITFALHGFEKAQQMIMQAAFASADKWSPPWSFTENLENARVVIVYLASESDFDIYDQMMLEFAHAEIIAFSPVKPQQAKWHLERQPNGKAPIVKFNQLVLKISHSIKRNLTDPLPHQHKTSVIKEIKENPPEILFPAELETIIQEQDDDISPFFNILDTLLDSKPDEKRKKFNEKS